MAQRNLYIYIYIIKNKTFLSIKIECFDRVHTNKASYYPTPDGLYTVECTEFHGNINETLQFYLKAGSKVTVSF